MLDNLTHSIDSDPSWKDLIWGQLLTPFIYNYDVVQAAFLEASRCSRFVRFVFLRKTSPQIPCHIQQPLVESHPKSAAQSRNKIKEPPLLSIRSHGRATHGAFWRGAMRIMRGCRVPCARLTAVYCINELFCTAFFSLPGRKEPTKIYFVRPDEACHGSLALLKRCYMTSGAELDKQQLYGHPQISFSSKGESSKQRLPSFYHPHRHRSLKGS